MLSALAFVSVELGHLDIAKQYAEQALELARSVGERSSELCPLFIKGQLTVHDGEYPGGERLLREVAQDPKSTVSLRWEAQNELARLFELRKRPTDADRQYKNALATLTCARASVQREEFRLPFLANAAHVYDDYIRFLIEQGKTGEALQAAEYSRAQTLAEGLGGGLRNDKNCTSLPRTKINPQQAANEAAGTVLFYWLGQRQSYLWVVTSKQTILITLPPATEIETLVQNYRKSLLEQRDVLEAGNKDGINLYEILVAPAQKFIPAGSHVTIIADGSLNNLNFERIKFE